MNQRQKGCPNRFYIIFATAIGMGATAAFAVGMGIMRPSATGKEETAAALTSGRSYCTDGLCSERGGSVK